ncbi:MAG: hypothetical protein D6808_04080, partial [Candidatus Dadabacteria bacterium]
MIFQMLYDKGMFAGSIAALPIFPMFSRGRARLPERYGSWKLEKSSPLIWFHGASVGEIKGLMPVIKKLKEQEDSLKAPYKILVSATSPTGLDSLNGIADFERLAPFDSSIWIRRAISAAPIKALILTETEFWPSLIREISDRDIPVYLINGRITDRGALINTLRKKLYAEIFHRISGFFVSNERAAELFARMGVTPEKIKVVGNSKYDIEPTVSSSAKAQEWSNRFFADTTKPVLVLGSIRPGEEEIWFDAYRNFSSKINMVVAPRHQEKFAYFERKLRQAHIPFTKWSLMEQGAPGATTVLLDTMGLLEKVYS